MRKKLLLVFVPAVVLVIFGFVFISKAGSETQTEVEKAISFLKSQTQDPWISMALAGAGESNIDLSHLASVTSGQKSSTTYAKYILALVANAKNPTNFGNEDYVAGLKSYFNNNQFGEVNFLNDDVWAILALSSIGENHSSQVQSSKAFLLTHQNADGGWGYNVGGDSDTNDTAVAIMALLEAGVSKSDASIQKAIDYLKSAQNNDAGFAYTPSTSSGQAGSASDSCSTAWVMSAVYKLGEDPLGSSWSKAGKTPRDLLLSLQDTDGGFFWQASGDNKFCSAFSGLALLGKSYPVETGSALHHIRIEGANENICDKDVFGATAMDLVISASQECGFNYQISEYPGLGLYLASIGNENSWMYLVNNLSLQIGASSYYLEQGDEVLWYAGDWLEAGWVPVKLEIVQTETLISIQALSFNSGISSWQNLALADFKIKVGSTEFLADNSGKVEIAPAILSDGFYPVFSDTQIIGGIGYIRSAQQSLKIGAIPQDHKVGLKVTIEQLVAPEKGKQSSISFSVSPDLLDFGVLQPGQIASSNLDISNGPTAIYLEAETSGGNIFKNNLFLDNQEVGKFSIEMTGMANKTLPVKLRVPESYSGDFGQATGELTFWAIKK